MIKYKLKDNAVNVKSQTFLKDYLLSVGVKEENINSFLYPPTATDQELITNAAYVHDACNLINNH